MEGVAWSWVGSSWVKHRFGYMHIPTLRSYHEAIHFIIVSIL